MEDKGLLTVGELAQKMGTTVRTLQYYDKEDLLRPSAKSEGGRRLYAKKDMVKLHQILSMKFLGFSLDEIKNNLISLDTPQEVVQILSKQKEAVKKQIENLTTALSALEALQDEVSQMQEVDFNKYADIITLLRLKNEGYWVVKFFDDRLMAHIKDRFTEQPDFALALYEKWKSMCDETVLLIKQGETPESGKGQEMAMQWWTLVIEFTGGDMSIIPELIKFNRSKQGWSKEMQEKQKVTDQFISDALKLYFQKQGIAVPEMEAGQ